MVTSTPSKYPYKRVYGLFCFPTIWILRLLINGMRSLLITLSPWDSLWLKSSIILCWVPDLLLLTVSSTSTRCCSTRRRVLKSPWVIVRCVCLRDPTVRSVLVRVPVQKSVQEPHICGPNPVWGSNPSLAAIVAIVDAKSPSLVTIRGSNLTVLTQVSDSGVNSRTPIQ